jgi:hypothetical protein
LAGNGDFVGAGEAICRILIGELTLNSDGDAVLVAFKGAFSWPKNGDITRGGSVWDALSMKKTFFVRLRSGLFPSGEDFCWSFARSSNSNRRAAISRVRRCSASRDFRSSVTSSLFLLSKLVNFSLEFGAVDHGLLS